MEENRITRSGCDIITKTLYNNRKYVIIQKNML